MIDFATMVQIAADEMEVDVCSLYLREGDALVLEATFGLRATSVRRVSMRLDEGLTGHAYQSARPLSVSEPAQHPRYRYFPASGEEEFRSYLGIPLDREYGVLVFQTRGAHFFTRSQIQAAEGWSARFSTMLAHEREERSSLSAGEERRRAIG